MFCTLKVKEELLACVKAAEESVFQLKRARLLQELDAISPAEEPEKFRPPGIANPTTTQDLNSSSAEGVSQLVQLSSITEGTVCRFRHTNGRWYNGKVCSVDKSGVARVFFLSPTNENMQVITKQYPSILLHHFSLIDDTVEYMKRC